MTHSEHEFQRSELEARSAIVLERMDTEESNSVVPEKSDKPKKISFWKLAVGLILVLAAIKNWLTPDESFPDVLKASNETQQQAAYAASIVIFLVGLGFVIAGVRALWPKRP